MPVMNYQNGEINIKIVYYGPGLSGKTTNLEYLYAKMPKENKGKMVSMKTRADRTLFFDFLPIDIGEINGMKIRFLLYTVPGQVYYNATRKLVLKGVDAVVFVADSSADRMQDNKESLKNLEENLNDLGLSLNELPWIIQYNKRDLPNRLDVDILEKHLNPTGVPSFEAVATKGIGVYETFESIAKIVFSKLKNTVKESKTQETQERDSDKPSVDYEVVATGSGREDSSETDDRSSLKSAENVEEELESVSEFVDNILTEKNEDDTIDLGATREGYEDYGHLVKLGEEQAEAEESKPEEDDYEIISDPLEKLKMEEEQPKKKSETSVIVEEKEEAPLERVIKVPIKVSKGKSVKEINIKVLLEIEE